MKKKNPKTHRALDVAAKLRAAGPPPEFHGLTRNKDVIMEEKRKTALQFWALQKMGVNLKKYLDQANRNFWTLVYLAVTVHGKDLITALKQTPYDFPLKPTQNSPIPFDLSTFIKIQEEYVRLLPTVQNAKRRTRHDPVAQRIGLAEALGITDKKKIGRYLGMIASDIVLDHLRSKHDLTVDIEAIHKHLSLVRHPMKMGRRMIKTIAKEAGVKLK